MNHISWDDAARFANWLHNGQPTGAQGPDTTEDGTYDLSPAHQYYGPNGKIPQQGYPEFEALNYALLTASRKADWKWAIPTEDEWYKAAYHKNDGVTDNYFDDPMSGDASVLGRDMSETTNPDISPCSPRRRVLSCPGGVRFLVFCLEYRPICLHRKRSSSLPGQEITAPIITVCLSRL